MQKFLSHPSIFLVVISLVLGAASYSASHLGLQLFVKQKLIEKIRPKLQQTYYSQIDELSMSASIMQRINLDLQKVQVNSPLKTIEACSIELVSLNDKIIKQGHMQIEWLFGNDQYLAQAKFDCQTNWPRLILTSLIFASLLLVVWLFAPKPRSKTQQMLIEQALEAGSSTPEAQKIAQNLEEHLRHLAPIVEYCQQNNLEIDTRALLLWLCEHRTLRLSEYQIHWFCKVSQLFSNDFDKALTTALLEDNLRFHPETTTIAIRDIDIKLSKTPFYYLLWYAQYKATNINHGWFINPATDKPDTLHSHQIVNLMRRFNGHAKAINELEKNGLRAKTLDQNRNKIKDEISAILGDDITPNFLFELERDIQTSRFKYRLKLKVQQINLPKTIQ